MVLTTLTMLVVFLKKVFMDFVRFCILLCSLRNLNDERSFNTIMSNFRTVFFQVVLYPTIITTSTCFQNYMIQI